MFAELAYWFLAAVLSIIVAFGWLVFAVVLLVVFVLVAVLAVIVYLDWKDGTLGR